MTLHVILGEGEMPPKELTAALNDLKRKDQAADTNHWYYVQGKAEPTTTDKGILAWMSKYNVWYGVVTADGNSIDPVYEGAEETLETKRLAPMIVGLMKEGPDEGEDADLLCLFASDDYSSESDKWLNDVGRAVQDAGFEVYAFNDGMIGMDFSDVEPPVLDEEEIPEPTPIRSKKAAPPVEDDDEETLPEIPGVYTRDQLEEMDLTKLKEIASNLGITLAPRTRIPTYINAILGEAPEEPGEVETEAPLVDGQMLTVNTNTNTSTPYTLANATSTIDVTAVSAPAMMIIVYNGTVMARPISPEEAHTLLYS